MASINLYKIDSNKIDDFLQDIKNSDFVKKTTTLLTEDVEGEKYEFEPILYIETPKQSNKEISWNWLLNEFDEPSINVYKAPKAILVIGEIRDESEEIYAVTFGNSFFKVDKYCDRDFGFKFAARIEFSNVKTTTLTSPNLKKNKTINTYIDYNELDFDSGESFAKLKVNIKIARDFNLFKPSIEIGNSIRFNVDNASIKKIVDIILYVEKILRIPEEEVKYKIPLFKAVKNDELMTILNGKLNRALEGSILQGDDNINRISIPELEIIGVSEVFNNNDDRFVLKYKRAESEITTLSLDTIKSFCVKYNIDSVEGINQIKVVRYKYDNPIFTELLKHIIEYTDDEHKCIYYQGKWYLFNEDYLSYLNDSIREIDAIYDYKYDFNESIHNQFIDDKYNEENGESKYKGKSVDEVKKSLRSKYYAERCYNLIREQEGHFKCYDREDINSGFEKMDLFEQETNTMFAVKFGKSSSGLCYAIDQSLTSLKKYKHGEIPDIPSISRVGLWFVLEKKEHLAAVNNKVDLTDLNMLMLKNRIDQWKKEVRLAGYIPIIYINYREK